jgi:hypothetical protein
MSRGTSGAPSGVTPLQRSHAKNNLGVGSIERIRDIDSQAEQLLGRQRPAHDALAQGHPFEQFRHNEVLPVLLADLMNRAYVG